MPNTPPNLMAAGNIYPCTFVKVSSTAFKCEAAGDNGAPIGISQVGTNYPPINDSTHVTVSSYAAVAGEMVRIHGDGDICLLKIGDTVTSGQYLKSDSNSYGVPLAGGSTVEYCGARALQGGSSGEYILVQVTLAPITTA